MPAIVCIVCGHGEEVPKGHADHEDLRNRPGVPASDNRAQHICPACVDRIRSEAVRQKDPTGPGGDG